ncbi:MAG TPA: histidine kinase [Nocardioides sp.]|nr:histidine kinase [Nocardioides sp.]
MDRPLPDDYQPRLRWWSHAWRTVLMLGISLLVWISVAENQTEVRFVLDIAVGLPAVALVFFRRRWPVAVAVLTVAMSFVSSLAAGPATLASVSLATRRRWIQVIPIAVLNVLASQVFYLVQPPTSEDPEWLTLSTNVVIIAGVMAWGMYIGSRRELLWTLRNRAETAEAEQEMRVSQARTTERARIAREMHDVLAHRISQISMHAGALSFRDDLTADEMRDSAGVIQEKAHEALTDLRGVLGVLRDDGSGRVGETPQPTYADLPALVSEAEEAGLNVSLDDDLDTRGTPVPDAVGRTLYRIVQEGMTNARKHAPGSRLTIQVTGSPEGGVDIRLRNPIGFGPSAAPGAGLGLVGLTERAELAGGRLEHRREGQTFLLHAWIPWAS